MHRNWCELNQGGMACDCPERDKKIPDHEYHHKNWCELNQGGLYCDCREKED